MTDLVAPSADLATRADAPLIAPWSRRVVAALLDGAVLSGATWLVLGAEGTAPSLQPTFGDTTASVPWFTSGWLVAVVVAMLALQGWTGATPGKRLAGVAVVRASDGTPAGLVASGLRVVAHLLDAILVIGYLRPLWNERGQTFADSILGTLVIQTREPAAHPWFARFRHQPTAGGSTAVTVAALVVCALGAGFSLTTSSWGGSWEVPVPCTEDGTVPEPAAVATASRAGGTMVDRRLWISRTTDENVDKALRVSWTWLSADAQQGHAQLETEIRRADGSVILQTQDGTGAGEAVLGTTDIYAEDLENAGRSWTAQTRLVVDGEVVGACTIDSADWDAAGVTS
ncbi:RDD family protein [uncultured Cellulomonas sp.]|uniref:RDD family protein n=1 Tax=uncultured Cellulomonas sp. TaxID=189682 RepID=UPI0028EC873D|nr:RDD family protein [uncultured Cellulomonas sp.]